MDEIPSAKIDESDMRLVFEPDTLTRLSYWFPLIEAAGLPVPATQIVRATDDEMRALWKSFDGDGDGQAILALAARIDAAALTLGPRPFFLRTDLTSAKHSWLKACYVDVDSELVRHVYEIAEFSACVDLDFDVWAVRELLKTDPVFIAFYGRMPITREFRFFVNDGVVTHVQPYWPPEAINNQQASVDDWRGRLAEISALDANERGVLEALTRRANEAVPGYWSVDWLWTRDRGWVLTDMAEGGKSFKWEP